jgi:RNA polymerase sigma-70 factor (ECF subfamily)
MTRNAFNDIIHNNYRKLYIIAFRILRNQQEAEDVVQEVFIKMWKMKEKLDQYDDVGALAVTITRNNCIDLLRKWKHIDSERDGAEMLNVELSPSPYDQLVNSETSAILYKIIEDLPPNFRDIVRLREIDGLSYEEIALKTETNINSLRVTVSRARSIIRDKYIRYTNETRGTERVTGTIL